MTTTFVAHVITAEADGLGAPEVFVTARDNESGEEFPIATYPMIDCDDVEDATDLLWEEGWRVLDAPSQADVGYFTATVEPADDDFTVDGMDAEEWLQAMTMD